MKPYLKIIPFILIGVFVMWLMFAFIGDRAGYEEQQAALIAARDKMLSERNAVIADLHVEINTLNKEKADNNSVRSDLEGQLSRKTEQLKKLMKKLSELPTGSFEMPDWFPSFTADIEGYIYLNQESRKIQESLEKKYKLIIAEKDGEIAELIKISNAQAKVKMPRIGVVLGIGVGYDPFQGRFNTGLQLTCGWRIK